MKVLKRGAGAWPRQIIVNCCGSTLEVEAVDIKGPSSSMGESNDDAWIECIACGGQSSIDVEVRRQATRWLEHQARS